MAKGHNRHDEHEEYEEHVNREAWVIPYADMLTLLMCLFLVLFAIGQTDASKAKLAAASFAAQLSGGSQPVSFGGFGATPIVGGNGVLDNTGAAIPSTSLAGISPISIVPQPPPFAPDVPTTTSPAERALEDANSAKDAAQTSVDDLTVIEKFLQAAADTNGIGNQLGFSLEARGLVLTIVTDQVLFQPGQADLQPGGVAILDLVATALASIRNNISVEGHTDSAPISTSRFPSNWELSTARATSVLRYLIDQHHIDPSSLSAVGFADTRPIGDNATPGGAARNRRVEIVILSAVSLEPVLDSRQASAS